MLNFRLQANADHSGEQRLYRAATLSFRYSAPSMLRRCRTLQCPGSMDFITVAGVAVRPKIIDFTGTTRHFPVLPNPAAENGTANIVRGESKNNENPAPCTTKKARGNQKVRKSHLPRRQSHCDTVTMYTTVTVYTVKVKLHCRGVHTHCHTVTVYTVTVTLPRCHCCTVTMSDCLTVYTVAVTVTLPRCTHSQSHCGCVQPQPHPLCRTVTNHEKQKPILEKCPQLPLLRAPPASSPRVSVRKKYWRFLILLTSSPDVR